MGLRNGLRGVGRLLRSEWVAVVLVSVLLLAAGARLVQLSMQQSAVRARAAAHGVVERDAAALQGQLHGLLQRARQRSALTSGIATAGDLRARLAALPEARGDFWLLADGSVLGVPAGDQSTVREIRGAWRGHGAEAPALQLLGPEPEGSRWIVAVRAPLQLPAKAAGDSPAGWAVAFQALDPLLVGARLNRLTAAGYQFELSRTDPTTRQPAVVVTSAVSPWSNPVTAGIALAAAPAAGGAGAPVQHWQLALQPRAGWYPTQRLVVDILLLLLVTWLVVLGVRDASRHMMDLRSALLSARRRLRRAQRQLTREVEVRQDLQRSIDHAQYHDAFTGLPNRHYFLGQLDRTLREMRTHSNQRAAVLLVAIDRFKVVTDTLGHTAGDELMVQITRVFDQVLGTQEHVLARWADDTLGVLLADAPDAQVVLAYAQALQQGLANPIRLRRHQIAVATSVGASCVASGLQRAEELLREADIALSGAKAQGGSMPVIYSAAMQSRLMHLVSLEGDLHAALQRKEFRLMFQPIVDLRARRIVGLEVLLRWLHPIEGLLTPDRFLNFAEESGLIVPITRWIIQSACQLCAEWQARLPRDGAFYTSINLSPAGLLDPGLSDYVAQVLAQTGTSPASLKFELTENGLINNVGAARAVLDRLHSMGIELMLDDFGTGYSSLSHLQLFPFDYIKIDGPVQGGPSEEPGNGALVRAMAQMASALGMKAVAETVESASAIEVLQQFGCDFAQGNAFCAPVDAEHAFQRLRKRILEPGESPDEPLEPVEDEGFADSPTVILPILSEPAST